MRGSAFRRPATRHFSVFSLCLGGAFVALARTAAAQDEAIVEQLAPLIAAEDARDFKPDLFARGMVAPDSLVRRIAALGAARIGDLRATPLIVPLLADPDSTVRVSAAFALGVLRDSAAVQPIIDRLTGLPALEPATAVEAVAALAKIGGPAVGGFFAGVLGGKVVLSQDDREPGTREIVLQSWRLGPDAPVANLLPFMDDTNAAVRWRAVFALGRLGAPAAAARMLLALRDEDIYIRSLAARALSRGYAQGGSTLPTTVADVLARLAADPNIQVQINALGALGSYHDSTLAVRIVPQLNDQVPNVQVAASEAMSNLGGSEAVKGLGRLASPRAVRGSPSGARGVGAGGHRSLRSRRECLAEEHGMARTRRCGRGYGSPRAGLGSLVSQPIATDASSRRDCRRGQPRTPGQTLSSSAPLDGS